jgi:glutamate racemase
MSTDSRPIGVFDSGIGGLTVVTQLLARLPHEHIVYFGDTARLPYGNKSPETVTRFSREIVHFLLRRDVKAIVVACNSASAVALPALAREVQLPLVGVIEPGAQTAASTTRSGRVGVLGTQATVHSNAYRSALLAANPELEVVQVPAPLFVHLAEEGWLDGEVPEAIARRYVGPLVDAAVDTVILGCTHYPLLTSMLSRVFGPDVVLVDSAHACAERVTDVLDEHAIAAPPGEAGDLTCFASDASQAFTDLGATFLGRSLGTVHPVEQTDQPWYTR